MLGTPHQISFGSSSEEDRWAGRVARMERCLQGFSAET
jgi:hypothetical protein